MIYGRGLFVWLWDILFSSPQALPPARVRTLLNCSSPISRGSNYRCPGIEDPRCDGRNCTAHCREFCQGLCLTPRPPVTPPSPPARCAICDEPVSTEQATVVHRTCGPMN
jgi:hypothetical protein